MFKGRSSGGRKNGGSSVVSISLDIIKLVFAPPILRAPLKVMMPEQAAAPVVEAASAKAEDKPKKKHEVALEKLQKKAKETASGDQLAYA